MVARVATVRVNGGFIEVRLRVIEKLGAGWWSNLRLPLDCVRSVAVLPRPIPGVLSDLNTGLAAGGAGIAETITLGDWGMRSGPGRALVAVYRNRPSIVIDLEHDVWRRVIVSHPQPDHVAGVLRSAAGLPPDPGS
jgi:hypothetical protein